jgi:hypothetical protein
MEVSGALPALLCSLEPLDPEGRTVLFCETRDKWTACFDNGSRRPEPEGIVSYLARQLEVRGVVFIATPNVAPEGKGSKRGVYGAFGFRLYGPGATNPSGLLRSVLLTNDHDGWHFEQIGDPIAFEDQSKYAARRLSARIDAQTLQKYAWFFGINLFDPSFYGPTAVKIFADLPLRKTPEKLSYKEAQEKLGLAMD